MMSKLLRRPFGTHGQVHEITAASAGWRYVGFSLHRLRRGDSAAGTTGGDEAILVMVEGKASFRDAGRDWGVLGDRLDVFEKTPPHCLYLPAGSAWDAVAETDCTVAVCAAPGRGGHAARRIGPEGITLTARGKGTNTRHVNNIAMEDQDVCDSLLVTEVFTPAGTGRATRRTATTRTTSLASPIWKKPIITGSTPPRGSGCSVSTRTTACSTRPWR